MDLVFSGLVAMGGGVSSSSSFTSLGLDEFRAVKEDEGVAFGTAPVPAKEWQKKGDFSQIWYDHLQNGHCAEPLTFLQLKRPLVNF